jgi:hypothetical protein
MPLLPPPPPPPPPPPCQVHDTYYLVAIIDNEYIDTDMYAIFRHVMQLLQSNPPPVEEDADIDGASGLVL